MASDVSTNIRQALQALESERTRIEKQIEALQRVLALTNGRATDGASGRAAETATPRKRRGMSAHARRAVSQRMKAYWAKRRAQAVRKQPARKAR